MREYSPRNFDEFGRQLYRSTALSATEVHSIAAVKDVLTFLFGHNQSGAYAYVGNVAIKSHMPPGMRGSVDTSKDIDIIFFEKTEKKDLENRLNGFRLPVEVNKSRLIDSHFKQYGSRAQVTERIRYSPYFVYQLKIDGSLVDVFNYGTGVGPIQVHEQDRVNIIMRFGIPVVDIGYLLATNLNPKALTPERLKRVKYLLLANESLLPAGTLDTFTRKMTEAVEHGTITHEELMKLQHSLQNSRSRRLFEEIGLLHTIEHISKSH